MAEGEFSLISNEKLLALYTGLLRCHGVGTNGTSGSMRGHEAALVGATMDLGPGDTVCCSGSGVLSGFSEGLAVPPILLRSESNEPAWRNGNEATKAGRNGASPAAPGLTYTYAAVGTALANKTKTNRKVAVVFSNEDSAEALREAVHVATVHALPVVFVHQPENDGERSGRQRARSKQRRSELKTPWFPSITVDRHDVVALYRVASEAISRARLGRGPTLIECRPYRLNGRRGDRNGFDAHDPILNMKHYLQVKGISIPN